MRPTTRRVIATAVMAILAVLSILIPSNVLLGGTSHRVVEIPHRGTWFAKYTVYGQSWQRYYRGQGERRPLRMQVVTRLYVVDKYGRASRSENVVKTVYNSDYVSAQARLAYRGYVSDAYSYTTFVVQHADGSWSWDSCYGPHSGPLG